MVISLVNKAMVDYPEREVEEAIAYTTGNVRGGSMQFKAYLDKTLKNKWAEGYFEAMQDQNDQGFSWDQMANRFHTNGFVTGSRRMDRNLAACLDFVAYAKGKGATA